MRTCPSCQAENENASEVCFTCRSVLAAVTQGSVLGGRYEILSVLGRGGMGTVYRARDRVLDEEIALKILRADVAGTPEMARGFRSEIKLARRVSHWNVCRIFEYGEEGSLRYLAMELVEGTNLKEVLRQKGPLPPARALEIAIQVAEGLAAVHQAGIVHRDLKTLNVMLDTQGNARVMDFGIAKRLLAEGAEAPTASGYVLGSPEYMSPEQARGRSVDPRSDVYALGIVVYELFTGRVPFRADTPVATLLRHLEAPLPLDEPEAATIPEALRGVLRSALAKDPGERFASAAEMADALRAALRASVGSAAGDSPQAAADPAAGPAASARKSDSRPLAGRSRRWWKVAAVVAIALGAGLAAKDWIVGQRDAAAPSAAATETAGAGSASPAPSTGTESAAPSVVATSRSAHDARPSPHSSDVRRLTNVSPSPAAPRQVPAPATTPPVSANVPSVLPSVAPSASPSAAPHAPSSSAEEKAGAGGSQPSPASTLPPPASSPAPLSEGSLLVLVQPWADVSVDDAPLGQTPLGRIRLAAGAHKVLVTHPDYQPFPRKVTIQPGQTYRLVVDLRSEGIRRKR